MAVHGVPSKRKEIYKYEAPWPLYSMNWSVRPDKRFRLALGSFVEEYNNKVQVVSLDEDTSEFSAKSTFDHPYPTTKIMWIPDSKGVFPDLLATSGDYLRVWRAGEPDTRLECVLNNNKNSDFCAPLTSFDWNEVDPNLIGTSSIDTTCTIWGLETGQVLGRVNLVTGHVKTQLIAHDKEVYDIAFSRAGGGRDMFASVGADGSVRMFDLRHLEHSTIIYEDPQHTPLLRLAWNKQDPNYLATVAMDACEVIILDVRVPCTPVARLNNHRACVNGIAWAPHSSCHICTAGDDHQALIWDIQQMPRAIEDPILAYTAAEGEINQIQWGATQPDWIAICYYKALEILLVLCSMSSCNVRVGDYVVIQRQCYTKLHKVTQKSMASLGKDQLELDTIIGKPFWTTYKMEGKGKRLFKLVECDGAESLAEQLIKDVTSGTDNRNILDDNASQSLSKDEIVGLRDSGLSGQEIVGQLIENSKTFHDKTEYAQKKYLLKKEKKYFEYLTIRKPTLRLVSQIMFRQDPAKIMWLRMDTISQITTAAGIHTQGTYIVYESGCQGLSVASMLNYLGEDGNLIHIHPGNIPQKQAVLAMNFDPQHISKLISVNVYSLLRMLFQENKVEDDEPAKDVIEGERDPMNDGEEGNINNPPCIEYPLVTTNSSSLNKTCHSPINVAESNSNKRKQNPSCEENIAKKPRWEQETEKAARLLRNRKVDGLVIVAREYPASIVTALLPFLAVSRPIVVYSSVREPLLDLYLTLKSRGDVVGLRLTETWLRSHQVLPDRSHPDILMSGSGGYMLTGTLVQRRDTSII
uniref:DDB1- and CUL4-associated factor 7 n=1 Tax=Timema californicum TaxID=61474 RepID=A0A7R9IXF1_TIMCA|nr:unnamed protein product [Timema californicum]